MDHATPRRWNNLRELQHPHQVNRLLDELHEDQIAHVLKEFLVLDVDIRELLVNLVRDLEKSWLRLLFELGCSVKFLLALDRRLVLLLRHASATGNTTSHVLRVVHLLDLIEVARDHDLCSGRCLRCCCRWLHIFSCINFRLFRSGCSCVGLSWLINGCLRHHLNIVCLPIHFRGSLVTSFYSLIVNFFSLHFCACFWFDF